MPLKREFLRKLIHLSMLVVPVGYYFLSRKTLIVFLSILLFTAIVVEILRRGHGAFGKWFLRITGDLLRDREREHLTGATVMFFSSLLSVLLFEKSIAITVILFLVISDGLSALVGKLLGQRIVFGNKTLAGCVTFFLTALIIVLTVYGGSFYIGFVGVIVALAADVFILRIDDNLTIPLAAGSAMQLLTWLVQ